MKFSRAAGTAAIVLVGASIGGAAVATFPLSDPDVSQHEALHFTVDHLAARHDAADGDYVEKSLADVLPNQEFSVEGAAAEPLAAAAVIGKVTAVRPGAAYAVSGDDASSGQEVAFDSTSAQWKVMILDVAVGEDLGDDVAGRTVRVGLSIDGSVSADTIAAGLTGQRVLLPLGAPGFFAFDRSLYSILESGALLGLVSDSGKVSMPVLGGEAAAFLDNVDTVAEVRDEAAQNKAPVVVATETSPGAGEG